MHRRVRLRVPVRFHARADAHDRRVTPGPADPVPGSRDRGRGRDERRGRGGGEDDARDGDTGEFTAVVAAGGEGVIGGREEGEAARGVLVAYGGSLGDAGVGSAAGVAVQAGDDEA